MPATVGVIEQFLHPPLQVLTPYVDTNAPYSGNVTLTNWSGGAIANTFGVIANVPGPIPSELGYTIGWEPGGSPQGGSEYEERLFQLVVQHQLASSAWVTTQVIDSHHLGVTVLWDVALPGRLGIYTLPGLSVDLFFLQV